MTPARAWPDGYALTEFAEIDSTNEEARRLASAGAATPVWIRADRQTAGRGRRGRTWSTPSGNLAATLLLRPERPAAECAQLSFVAALAVADTVGALMPAAETRLKWPNDVLVDGAKIAGILLESVSGAGPAPLWLAIGIGINLVSHPEGVAFPATSVAAHRPPPPAADVLCDLACAFAKWYEIWRAQGFGPIREAFMARAARLGEPITARLTDEDVTGVFEGIDESGALLLRLSPATLRIIAAGDVYFGR